jgi:prevent-host-death family protein
MDDGKLRVPAADFQRNVGRYQDVALTRPVTITKNGRDRTVLISAEEYERLKRHDRRVIVSGEFTQAELDAIESAEVPVEYGYLNEETKDLKP